MLQLNNVSYSYRKGDTALSDVSVGVPRDCICFWVRTAPEKPPCSTS